MEKDDTNNSGMDFSKEDSTSNDDPDAASGSQDVSQNTPDDDGLTGADVDKYKQAFGLLWPDSQGTVHKDKLLEFFKSILGALYSEDMANCLIDIMNPDEGGNISMENFVHAFSLAYWTPESVAAMHNVLITNPDIIAKMFLRNLGMDMSDSEVNTIIQQAQVRATALLSAELSRSPSYSVEDKEEVHRKSGEILNSIRAKLSGMDIHALSTAGSGESGSKDPSVVSGSACHPETPLFPAVPDKMEAEDQKENQVLKTD
ncbi:hypothetical protein GE061_014727 [Apolygus lucorum]|uniref:EF-hand domain-containing protein n=1 Tax=Apolygus lucorum TaxID=248454 RepID=A0A8S9XK89_APOLU|nr:hypothetical protein GE061_014727 [Apolygus lucorum]